jgi:hypothetical protein
MPALPEYGKALAEIKDVLGGVGGEEGVKG